MDEQGIRFLDYIPSELITHKHDTDMRIHFSNGSILQLIGSDNIDSIMSTNPVGCVFSEYALQDPAGWRFVTPILAKNGGWAAFAYTPRGHNHGYELYQRTRGRDGWFTERLTVDDTGLVSPDAIEDVRASGVPEEIIRQEFWCDFTTTNEGAYFGQDMLKAEKDGRVRELTYDPRQLVHTAWDLGVNDSTTIWFVQTDGRTFWAIDFYENSSKGLPHYVGILHDKGYVYGTHLGPHDTAKREFTTGASILDSAADLGLSFTVVPRTAKTDQHNAAHLLIPRTVFCSRACERGIEGLKGYERKWDQAAKVFGNTPNHNWASHIADAYMVLATGHELIAHDTNRPSHSVGSFNPREYEQYGSFDPRHAAPQEETYSVQGFDYSRSYR